MRQGPSEAPQSGLGYSLEQLNAQGLGLTEYADALDRLSRDPWFHGKAYDQERDWLAGKADFYRTVEDAIAIGQTGTGEDLDAAIEALERLSSQPAITTQQLEYLEQVINSHEGARETVTAARESAVEAWEGRVLGNINTFGDPDAKARARAVLDDDGTLTGEERWDALAKIEAQAFAATAHHANLGAWENKVLGNIDIFGDPDAKARAQAVLDDGTLTGEERRDALVKIQDHAWEEIEKHNEEVVQEVRDLAMSLGWDPDSRGGRPELTPREFIAQSNRDIARSLGWDPDTRGGRPELTLREFIQQYGEQVAAENLALAIEHGYLPEGPERTPMTPEGYLRRLQVEAYGTATLGEAGALENQAVIASANLDFTEAGSLEEEDLTAAYNRWFQELTGVEPTGNQAQDRALLRHAASQQLFSGFGGDDLAIDDEARFREEQSVAFRRSFETRQKLGDVNRLEDLRTASSEGSLSPGDVIRIDFVDGQSIVLDPAEPVDQKAFGDATTIFRDDPEMLRRMYDYAAQYGHVRPYVPQPGDDSERARAFQSAAADAAQIPLVPRSVLLTPHGRLLGGVVKRVYSRSSLPGVGRWPSTTPFSWHNGSPLRATA